MLYLRYPGEEFLKPAGVVRRRVLEVATQHLHVPVLDALQFYFCNRQSTISIRSTHAVHHALKHQ